MRGPTNIDVTCGGTRGSDALATLATILIHVSRVSMRDRESANHAATFFVGGEKPAMP